MTTKETKIILSGDTSKYERAMRDTELKNRQFTDTLRKHWVAFAAGAVAAVMLLKKGITKLYTTVKEFVDLSAIQELAEINLAAALKASGEYTDDLNKKYQDFASNIQKVTKYGDEEVLMLMALMKNLEVSTDKVEEATKMAIGLATATGRDVQSMAQYVALAQQGEFTMLRRYIPALRATTDKTEQLRIITEFAARGFKVAEEQTSSFAIGLIQLKNLWGDLKEKLGDFIIKNELVLNLMKRTKEKLVEVNEELAEWYKNNKDLIDQKVSEIINEISTAIRNVVAAMKVLYKFKNVFKEIFSAIPGVEELKLLYKILSKTTEEKGQTGIIRMRIPKYISPTESKYTPPTISPLSEDIVKALEEENKYIEESLQIQWEMQQEAAQKKLDLISETLKEEDDLITEAAIKQVDFLYDLKEKAEEKELDLLQTAMDEQNKIMEEALEEEKDELFDLMKVKETLADETARNMQNSFQSLYFDVLKGRMSEMKDYVQGLSDAMLQSIVSVAAQMTIVWLIQKAKEIAGIVSATTAVGVETAALTVQIGVVNVLTAAYIALAVAKAAAGASGGEGFGSILGGLFHGGGTVGSTPVPVRLINPVMFANAPRYHSGLGRDEFPAILQRGETVLPKGTSTQPIVIRLEIGGKPLNTYIYRGTRSGTIQIHNRALVSR